MKTRACHLTVLVLLLTVLTLVAGCGPEPSAKSWPGAPVVFISIDTLRSDRLPVYGYGGVETPAIDALARDAVVFERAYSHYPLTLPAHASILTGLLPTEHGVRDNVGYRLDSARLPFLPRLLKERGYHTGGAVSAYILRGDTGMGEGFDFYEDSLTLRGGAALGENQRPGAETARRAVDWLETVASGPEDGEPFFLFVHLYEPHTPYEPPEPWASRYAANPYDGEIAAADAVVGDLVAALRRLGVYDRAIVVLFSDHGEGLGDHGELEHGILLYRESLEVPLVLKLPGGELAGTRVEATAQLTDLVPTVLALTGEDVGATTLLDLLGDEPPRREVYSETWYPRLHLGWSELTSLVEGDLHYIEGPDPELYDLASDPGESKNVLTARRKELLDMRQKLEGLKRELEAPAEVDAETAERLATLGYLTSSAAVSSGPLPDPKTQLPVLDELRAASHLQVDGDFAAAAERYRQVLDKNPTIADAWESLGQCLHRLRRYDEAAAAYAKAMELSGGVDHVALGAARLFLDMRRFQEARQHAELALATNPAVAHLVLARVALQEDDLDTAGAEAERSVAARPGTVAAHLLLAQIALKKEDLTAAEAHLERAEREEARRQEEESTPGVHALRGELEARHGNAETAEASFREEIRLHPDNTRAWSSLALLYTLLGHPDEAVGVLRQMVEVNRSPEAYAAAVETLRILGDSQGAGRLLRHALGLFPGDPELEALKGG